MKGMLDFGRPLEHRRNDDDTEFAGQRPHALGRRARDGLGPLEVLRLGLHAEVHGVEQLRQAGDLGPARRALPHQALGAGDVGGPIRVADELQSGDS